MKLNISFPANGSQKLIEIEDERKLRVFMEKRYDYITHCGWMGMGIVRCIGTAHIALGHIAQLPIVPSHIVHQL